MSEKSALMRNLLSWMAAALVIFLFWSVSSRIQKNERHLSFTDFMTQMGNGHVAKVTIMATSGGSQIIGEFKNGQSIRTYAPPMNDLVNMMLDKDVEVSARDANSSSWLSHIISWTPIVIMIAFLIFFMRQMQSAPGVSTAIRAAERKERRLAFKARFLQALTVAQGELAEHELISALTNKDLVDSDEIEAQKALHEMLSDGVVVLTENQSFRLRTTP